MTILCIVIFLLQSIISFLVTCMNVFFMNSYKYYYICINTFSRSTEYWNYIRDMHLCTSHTAVKTEVWENWNLWFAYIIWMLKFSKFGIDHRMSTVCFSDFWWLKARCRKFITLLAKVFQSILSVLLLLTVTLRLYKNWHN